jgi:hypothetical protein
MSTNSRQLSQCNCTFSFWYQIDMKMTSKTWLVIIHIKPLSKYHSHQTLIKIFWHHFDQEFIWSDFEMWSENVDFFESNSYQFFWSDFNNKSDQQHFKCLVGYMALHGVTWRYIFFLVCHVEILLSEVVTGSWHISAHEDSLPWTCLRGLARHFKTDPTETVALCSGYPKTPCLRGSKTQQSNHIK